MKTTLSKNILTLTALFSLGSGAIADSVVTEWNNKLLTAVRDVKFGPPQTARALAIVHTATYDAWAAYDAKAVGTTYFGALRRPLVDRTAENKHKAISFAAYRTLSNLFPARQADFDAAMVAYGYDINDTAVSVATPSGLGNLIAASIIADRRYDGANQYGEINGGAAYTDYTGYAPVNAPITLAGPNSPAVTDPNRWQPVQFNNGSTNPTPGFLVPHWANVEPFALPYSSRFRPKAPARNKPGKPAGGEYLAQAKNILDETAKLDDRKKAIAEYWADGPASETPPGHWQLFTQFVSHRDGYGVDDDAKLFFMMGNVMLDASIATWEAKRFYDSVRPITAIRFAFQGKTVKSYDGLDVQGEDWKPFQPASFLTPPFGEHTSGHSAFSAGGAYILRKFTKSDVFGNSAVVAAGSSKVQPSTVPAANVTLTWPTFTSAAAEAGLSRRYGGIHFLKGDMGGRTLGSLVGAVVFKKSQLYFNGTIFNGQD